MDQTEREDTLAAFGMTSLVLGFIGMLLFFLPILGLPISTLALGFGILGVICSRFHFGVSLRWSLAGIGASLLALGINVMLFYAPADYWPNLTGQPNWWSVPDRPYVPPPARD